MINEVIISRLDEIIGDYDTAFFNYLLYSYDLNLNDCEVIIDNLKEDINSNKVLTDNIVLTLENYFKARVVENEKQDKIEFLTQLISKDSEFYKKYLKRYKLSDEDTALVYDRVRDKIIKDNITDFEIKRYLEYYSSNLLKQVSYISELESIVGRNFDTLRIKNALKKYPILNENDIIYIISDIRGDILDAVEFKKPIKDEFLKRCMIKSESKKASVFKKLDEVIEGNGDTFSMFLKSKNLSDRDSEIVLNQIRRDISNGLVQPNINYNVFITQRFNEYIENEKQ